MLAAMSEFLIMGPSAEVIDSVERWFELAPPKRGRDHWVDGKSAKELAKAWFRSGRGALPSELVALLASPMATRDAELTVALAERVTRFDGYGEGRNHDLLLQMRRDDEAKIIVGIEAKVVERLDDTVIAKMDEAKRIEGAGKHTNLQRRVEELVLALFGRTLADVRLGALRYQMLTAAAGTLVEAKDREAKLAVLVVHDLSANASDKNALTPTQMDVSDFVIALGGDGLPMGPGRLYGPFKIAGGGRIPSNVPLYVGLIEATERRDPAGGH